jgi:hypothetical protein
MEALTEKTIQSEQLRVGRRLEYFTLSWNLGEAAVAVGAGLFASCAYLSAILLAGPAVQRSVWLVVGRPGRCVMYVADDSS